MPFISEEELNARLKSPNNLANKVSTLFLEPIKSVGKREELPHDIKKVVALLASDPDNEESQTEIGKSFGVTQPSVSRFSRGRTDESIRYENPELKALVDKNQARRETAETKAIDTLLTTLDLIPNKLSESTSIKTLSTLAKSMSEVADKMSARKTQQELNQQVHLHIFVPKQKDVSDYDVIDV